MSEGFLNKDAIEKNVDNISVYASEEVKVLKEILTTLAEMKGYKSENRALKEKNDIFLKNSVEKIIEKRSEYMRILKKAIDLYDSLATSTVKRFEGGLE